jgi:hypothetical protein
MVSLVVVTTVARHTLQKIAQIPTKVSIGFVAPMDKSSTRRGSFVIGAQYSSLFTNSR